jgi:NAD(P)-dependent dehydrogenase (short-subunit alcohol dehydrogenase family)
MTWAAIRRLGQRLARASRPRAISPPAAATTAGGRLDGRTALVVGGGRIGRAVSEAFLRAGAAVHQVDIRPGLAPDGAVEHLADVADMASIDQLWERIGVPVDLLVHAAGCQPPVGAFDTSEIEQWRRTLDTNLLGLMRLTQLVGRDLKRTRRQGSILLIASTHHAVTGGWPAYSASKAAVIMFMREIALEWAPFGIRVNAISPGWVAHADERHAADFAHMPLGRRAIPPDHVAKAALFLASDQSAFTTGTVLAVDGGLSLRSYRTAAITGPDDPHIRRYGDD